MFGFASFQKHVPLHLSIVFQNAMRYSPQILTQRITRTCFPNRLRNAAVQYHNIRTCLPKPLVPTWLVTTKLLSLSRLSQNVVTDESELFKKYLSSLLQEYDTLEAQVNMERSPQTKKVTQQMTNRYVELMHVALKIRELHTKETELREIEEFLSEFGSQDKELKVTAEQEKADCIQDIQSLELEVKELLSTNSADDTREIILELMPGVGGQESQVFAQEMFAMYQNYAFYKGWSYSVITEDRTEIGGIRRGSVIITGENVYEYLKFEGGVHRVQRIPKTERGGRVHTSTVTVAILPQPKEIDIILNAKDLQITTCRASGSGGQHVNTTDSAVRIVHLPTGISAESQQERSQIRNKELAMKLLTSRIYEKQLKAQTEEVHSNRKQQIGNAGRSEKIRTYNFNQDRITDHRINHNVYNVAQFFMEGHSLDILINELQSAKNRDVLSEKLEEFSLSLQNNDI